MARKKKEQIPPEVMSRRETYDWMHSIIIALIACVFIFVFGIRVINVAGSSMNPTLNNGEKMLVSNLFYSPEVGDVVVFKKDEYDPNKALVKRIIAIEGQEINMDFETGTIYIDGQPIEEDYISELTVSKLDFIGPKTVPDGCVFVMGDNRNASTDSRDSRIGMVDARLILGKVYCVIYPVPSFRYIR